MNARIVRFPPSQGSLTRENARSATDRLFATPIEQRAKRALELRLEEPELILSVCETLRGKIEADPAFVREQAEHFYGFLRAPERPIGSFDERDYFLGELALIAGTACRFLFRREDCRRWFDRAEAHFVFTVNSASHIARLAYQRLALAAEERKFDEVLELGPFWAENLNRMGLSEEALKCRFLEANALREIGEVAKAISVTREICDRAKELEIVRLEAIAASNLVGYCRATGDFADAMTYASEALPLLQQLNNRVNLAKLRWVMGDLLRDQGNLSEAIVTYRAALGEAEEIGMRGDVAAIHLVLADVLLDAGQDAQAEWEIRAALPIIDEERMVPEGLAALSLLRESLRRRKIDQQALRNLHGFFRE